MADVTSLPVAILSGRGVIGCTNRYSKDGGLSFYRFPEEAAKRAQWIAAVSRKNWQPTEHAWICIAPILSVVQKVANDPLSPAYIPSIFIHVESPVKRKSERDMIRYATRKRKFEEYLKEEPQADHNSEPEIEVPAVATMTALSMYYINQLEEENQHLREENHSLKDVIAKQEMHEHSFRDNPTKVKFYTGLPSFATLMVMFEFVAPYVPSTRCVLPIMFQQFLMVLMKLR